MTEGQMLFFKKYKEIQNAYDMALNTLSFDLATIAPKRGIPYRNHMLSLLSDEAFSHKTDTESLKKLEDLSKEKGLSEEVKKEIDYILHGLDNIQSLPKELYVEFTQLQAESQAAWKEAKEKMITNFSNPI